MIIGQKPSPTSKTHYGSVASFFKKWIKEILLQSRSPIKIFVFHYQWTLDNCQWLDPHSPIYRRNAGSRKIQIYDSYFLRFPTITHRARFYISTPHTFAVPHRAASRYSVLWSEKSRFDDISIAIRGERSLRWVRSICQTTLFDNRIFALMADAEAAVSVARLAKKTHVEACAHLVSIIKRWRRQRRRYGSLVILFFCYSAN